MSGLPAGVEQGNVSPVNEHAIEITLKGNSTVDYDEDCPIIVIISKDIIENSYLNADLTDTFVLKSTKEPSPPAPNVSFSFDGAQPGVLVGTTEQMEYSLDGGSTYIQAAENGTKLSPGELQNITESNDIRVRQKETLRIPSGQAQVIDIIEAPAAPIIYVNDEDNTLSGIDQTMEYSLDDGNTWTAYNGELPYLSGSVTVSIRKSATGTTKAGAACTVTLAVQTIQYPTADKQSGTYTGAIAVELAASTAGASIYYTLDGSNPTAASNLYTYPITISSNTTLNTIAIKNGYLSSVNTYIYTIKTKTSRGGGGAVAGDAGSAKNPTVKEISTTKDQNGEVSEIISIDKTIVEHPEAYSSGDQILVNARTGKNADRISLQIPASVFIKSAEENKNLKIITDKLAFEIEPGMIELGEKEANVKLNVRYMQITDNQSSFPNMPKEANIASNVFDFELISGEEKVTEFNKPMVITAPYETSKVKDVNKAGVFYYNESDETWEYVGGKVNNEGTISFSVGHFSKYAVLEYDKTFGDISNHWAKYDIEVMASKQMVNGKTAEDFIPDQYISRAEFVALLTRAIRIEPKGDYQKFTDVPEDAWYKNYVDAASSLKLVKGKENGDFGPEDNISREQTAAILVRAYKFRVGNVETTPNETTLTDISEAESWAQEDIRIAYGMNLITGYPDGRFAPKESLTRAQAVVLIKRLLEKL